MEDYFKQEDGIIKSRFDRYMRDFPLTNDDLSKSILDVGSGDGGFIQYVRDVLGNKKAVGVEMYQGRIKFLKDGAVVANGTSLPFNDESFEIVVSHNYLSMFLDNDLMLKENLNELLRVSKNKIIADITEPKKDDITEVYDRKKYNKWLDGRIGNWRYLMEYLGILKSKGYSVEIKEDNDKKILVIVKP